MLLMLIKSWFKWYLIGVWRSCFGDELNPRIIFKVRISGQKYPVFCDHSKQHLVLFPYITRLLFRIILPEDINTIMLRLLALAISAGKSNIKKIEKTPIFLKYLLLENLNLLFAICSNVLFRSRLLHTPIVPGRTNMARWMWYWNEAISYRPRFKYDCWGSCSYWLPKLL